MTILYTIEWKGQTESKYCLYVYPITAINAQIIPDPEITVPANVHFVVGYPFKLVCWVRTPKLVKMTWTTPHNDGPVRKLIYPII